MSAHTIIYSTSVVYIVNQTEPTAAKIESTLSHQVRGFGSPPEVPLTLLTFKYPFHPGLREINGRVNYEPHGGFTVEFEELQFSKSTSCSSTGKAAKACMEYIDEYFGPENRSEIHTIQKIEPA